MSTTTKALAIMGVVAGLGVAALPMSSYAATDLLHLAFRLRSMIIFPSNLLLQKTPT